MNDRGKVIIIPDENKILKESYEKEIIMNHLEAYQDFSDKFRLGYHFNDGDYQEAPIQIARDGHMSIKTIDDAGLFVIYIPELVTDRQINWFYKNMDQYSTYQTSGAYAIWKEGTKTIEGIQETLKELNKRNMLYEKKEEEKYVGKEI